MTIIIFSFSNLKSNKNKINVTLQRGGWWRAKEKADFIFTIYFYTYILFLYSIIKTALFVSLTGVHRTWLCQQA